MIKAVIFDIDGVLLDSLNSNRVYINDMLKIAGYPPLTKRQYSQMYHLSLWDVIKRVTRLRSRQKIQKIHDIIKTLPDRPQHYAKIAPHAITTLQTLYKGYKLALVSNRTRQNIITDDFELAPQVRKYITAVISFEDTRQHKPHPEPLLLAAKRLKVKPQECVYIGDARSDVHAAKAARMKVIIYGPTRIKGADCSTKIFAKIPGLIRTLDKRISSD